MKLIHCADLHLDSALDSRLDKSRARVRRGELLANFERLAEYAEQQRVSGILMAGDLFDTGRVSAGAMSLVLGTIRDHADITFYCLKGNHGENKFAGLEQLPANLKLFGEEWTSYEAGNVKIWGCEPPKGAPAPQPPDVRREDINIVMLHGQVTAGYSAPDGGSIPIDAYRGRGIDYLALGHIHSYQRESLDRRGVWAYSGCLEGRGFDECGRKGFILLDIHEDDRTAADTFVPFAVRTLWEAEADIGGCRDMRDVRAAADAALRGLEAAECDRVRLVLTGCTDVEMQVDEAYLKAAFSDRFWDFQVKNSTKPTVNTGSYAGDESLKGEFVRLVMAGSELTETDKAEVIRCGLAALRGEGEF